ncbi:GNAT family N-acetyltransferase [Asanoa ishikariensis]|nr:GNAT family N-acetyltransferase [Asanoa ishikariensis]
MYEAARKWLASIGSDQWAANTPERIRPKIVYSVQRRECFVAVVEGTIVGTVTIDDAADPEFWSPEESSDKALYLHRMVVAESARRKSVGQAMLKMATTLAASRGCRWLRLDAWRTNTKLHRYYEDQGFAHVRTVDLSHRGSGALFQTPVHQS